MVKFDVHMHFKCVKDRTVRHKKSLGVAKAEAVAWSIRFASCSGEILLATNNKDARATGKQHDFHSLVFNASVTKKKLA